MSNPDPIVAVGHFLETPLSVAVSRQNLDLVNDLLATGRVDVHFGAGLYTGVLELAAQHRHPAIFRRILEARNFVIDSQRDALCLTIAIEKRNPATVRILLDLGMSTEIQTNGRTPVLHAAWHSRADFVNLLLDAGANPLAKDPEGRSLLTLFLEGASGKEEHEIKGLFKRLLRIPDMDVEEDVVAQQSAALLTTAGPESSVFS